MLCQIIADSQVQNKLDQVQQAHSTVIGAYMDAARKLWDMQDARDCEVRARAWRVAEQYHENARGGEDAGIRGYIENLPPSMALEYATAITLSTQIRSTCKIHHVTMWVQRDGNLSHWSDDGDGHKVRCYGADPDDIAETHRDAIAEMPELAAL